MIPMRDGIKLAARNVYRPADADGREAAFDGKFPAAAQPRAATTSGNGNSRRRGNTTP